MKKNLVPLLVIAFVVAIVSTGIFYGLFVSRLQSRPDSGGQKLVVASRTLSRGEQIQSVDVKVISWPATALPKGAFTDEKQVAGLTVIQPVGENEPLLDTRVASKDGKFAGGLSIPAGMRAVTVHATDSLGVVEMLQPGFRVDVQLVSQVGEPGELRTIAQNVEVLQIHLPKDQRSTPLVTLLVTPQQADAAGLGDSTARLRMVLRNPLDEEVPDLQRQTLDPLFKNPPPPSLTRLESMAPAAAAKR